MRIIRPRLARRWRSLPAILAIYALVLHAIFATAATAASVMSRGDGHGVICRGDIGHADAGKDGGRLHDECGACQGLCAHHGLAVTDPSGHGARWLAPDGLGRLIEPAAIANPGPGVRAKAGYARAPPRLAASFVRI
jgi:hypothetical protein